VAARAAASVTGVVIAVDGMARPETASRASVVVATAPLALINITPAR
jgi:hypothetical protein